MEAIKPLGYRFHKTGSASPIHPNSSISRSNSSNSIHNRSNPDPKLNQIVRKIISTTPSLLVNSKSNTAAKNATNAIVDIIYEKHREYRRKEREVVVKGVDCVIGEILAENSNNNNSTTNTSGKRRQVAVGGGSDSAVENESKRIKSEGIVSAINLEPSDLFVIDSQPILGAELDKSSALEETPNQGGGMLNASLRNRYKEQREKEIANTNASALNSGASVESKEVDSVDGAVKETPMKTGEPEKETANSNITDTPNNTPKKKKKIKKTPSKSSTFESADPLISSNNLILPSPRPTERYSTLGGISKLLTTIRQLIEYPLSHPELFTHLGIEPPRGVLLRGPPVSVS